MFCFQPWSILVNLSSVFILCSFVLLCSSWFPMLLQCSLCFLFCILFPIFCSSALVCFKKVCFENLFHSTVSFLCKTTSFKNAVYISFLKMEEFPNSNWKQQMGSSEVVNHITLGIWMLHPITCWVQWVLSGASYEWHKTTEIRTGDIRVGDMTYAMIGTTKHFKVIVMQILNKKTNNKSYTYSICHSFPLWFSITLCIAQFLCCNTSRLFN